MFPIPFNFPFIKKNGERTTIGDAINAGGGGSQYTLPTASANTKGGVKIGSGLTMTGEVLSNNNPTPYSLPTASDETLGGIKVGSGLSITDGVLSASGGGGTQIYYKDYSNITFGNWLAIVDNLFYGDNSSTNINISGYTPIGVVITDKNTGYRTNGAISKIGTSGNNHEITLYATKSSPSSSFNARVYYVADTGIIEVPT